MLPARSRITVLKVFPTKADALANTNGTSYTAGIVDSSAHLDRTFYRSLPGFGECNAAMFECELAINVDLTGKWIRVATQAYATDAATSRTTYWLFTGLVDSCKYDAQQATRKLVAYDEMYTLRNTDISAWWNTYFSTLTSNPGMGTVVSDMMTAFGVTGTAATTISNSYILIASAQQSQLFSGCSFAQVLSYIGTARRMSFYMNAVGALTACSYASVNKTNTPVALDGNVDTNQSMFGDDVSSEFSNVCIYDGTTVAYTDGSNPPTYAINNNPMLKGRNATQYNSIGTEMLTTLQSMSGLRSAEIVLIVSSPDVVLVRPVAVSYNGVTYMASGITMSGPQLIDQTIMCTNEMEETPYYASSVTSTSIANGAVSEAKIADGAIGTAKLAELAVTEGKIAANAVTGGKIANLAVDNAKLAANAVTEGKLAANAVTEGKIAANAVVADKIASNAVTADKIAALAVTTGKLDAGAVTANKIASNAITADKIDAGAVTSAKIDAGAVVADKIASGAVSTDKLAALAVTAAKIDSGAITTDKLDAGAVTAAKIASGTITVTNMSNDAQDAMLNSNIEVGGRNLALRTATMPTSGTPQWNISVAGTKSTVDIVDAPISGITKAVRVTNETSAATRCGIAESGITGIIVGNMYTVSGWIRASVANLTIDIRAIYSSSGSTSAKSSYTTTTTWQYVKFEGSTLASSTGTSFTVGLFHVRDLPVNGWFEVCGVKVEEGNKATAWSPAPEDETAYADDTFATKAAASSSSQRIYYRSNSNTAPTAPNTFIDTTTVANKTWTLKRMPIVSDGSGYVYIWTCTQTKTVSGTVTNSDVLLDDTTTVIDGGKIIAGSVDTNQLNANAVTAAKIATGAVTADKISVTDLQAIGATIGGWSLESTRIFKEITIGDYVYQVYMNAPATPVAGNLAVGIRKRATNSSTWSYPCYFNYSGDFYATNAHITGGDVAGSTVGTGVNAGNLTTGTLSADRIGANTITAGKLSITDLQAIGATIAGWDISTDRIYKSVTADGTTYEVALFAPATPGLNNAAFYVRKKASGDADWTYMFYARYNGQVYARQITVGSDSTVPGSTVGTGVDAGNLTTGTLNAARIATGSLSADKISVTDLQAFGATIAGWGISSTQISKSFTIDGVTYKAYMQAKGSDAIASNGAFVIARTENGSTTYPFVVRYNGQLTANDANIRGTIVTGDFTANGKVRIAPDYDLQEAGVYALELVDQYDQSTIMNPDFANIAVFPDGSGVHIDTSYVSVRNSSGSTDTTVELENLGAGSTGLRVAEGEIGQAGYKESYLGADQLVVNGKDILNTHESLMAGLWTAIGLTADLNTPTLCNVGNYSCVDASSVTNCPTSNPFAMKVRTLYGTATNLDGAYSLVIREITDNAGIKYIQECHRNAAGSSIVYNPWRKLIRANDLATVATSGSYNDLSDKPTITDTKVTQTATTTNASYPLLFGESSFTQNTQVTTKTEAARISGGIFVNPNTATINARRIHTGTTSQYGRIVLGNNIASGTAGCSHGEMYLYGKGDKYVRIGDIDGVIDANQTYKFPNQSGYLVVDAVTSGSGTATSSVASGGTATWSRTGKIVSVSIASLKATTSTNPSKLFTGLPKATQDTYFVCQTTATATYRHAMLKINTDGEIMNAGDALSSSAAVYGNVMYITSE